VGRPVNGKGHVREFAIQGRGSRTRIDAYPWIRGSAATETLAWRCAKSWERRLGIGYLSAETPLDTVVISVTQQLFAPIASPLGLWRSVIPVRHWLWSMGPWQVNVLSAADPTR